MKEEVYMNFSKSSEVHSEKITVQDVCEVWCRNSAILSGIKNTAIARVGTDKDRVYVITAISVIRLLYEKFPDISIQNLGETEFAVLFHKKKKMNIIWQTLKIIFISCIIFCGGAFAIMAYGNDIDIDTVFQTLSQCFTGDENDNGMLIRIAYSIGLSVGIIIFFNNFGKRKTAKDPTPIQVAMRNYEEDIYKTIINNSMREDNSENVD